MKSQSLFLLVGLVLCGASVLFAQEKSEPKHEHKESEAASEGGRFGAHMAVTAFDKEEGFKLSERAEKSLGVKFQILKGLGPWRVPKSALVTVKHSNAVYRRYEGWIALVLVKMHSADKESILITSEDLQPGDEIATAATQFIRMTELDLNSDTVDTCSH